MASVLSLQLFNFSNSVFFSLFCFSLWICKCHYMLHISQWKVCLIWKKKYCLRFKILSYTYRKTSMDLGSVWILIWCALTPGGAESPPPIFFFKLLKKPQINHPWKFVNFPDRSCMDFQKENKIRNFVQPPFSSPFETMLKNHKKRLN